MRSSPRRTPLPMAPGLPAAQHLGQPPPLLPSGLAQRYLEHLLLPPPPQLGYEEALLHPYSYHKVRGRARILSQPLLPVLGCTVGADPRLWFGCSLATRTPHTSSQVARPGRVPMPPHCWSAACMGLAPCPPTAGSQRQKVGTSSRIWACLHCPGRKLPTWTRPAPGPCTVCGSQVTTGMWGSGIRQHPWLPGHPLHRQVHIPWAWGSPSHLPSIPQNPNPWPHLGAELSPNATSPCRCLPEETGLPAG